MSERFNVEILESSMLLYEDKNYLGEITLLSRNIVDRLNNLYDENHSYEELLNQYRKTNDYLVTLLAEASKQGFEIELDKIINEINNLKE